MCYYEILNPIQNRGRGLMLNKIMHLTVILFLYGVILVRRTLWYEYCELDNHGDPHPLPYMSTIKNPGMWKTLKVEFTVSNVG